MIIAVQIDDAYKTLMNEPGAMPAIQKAISQALLQFESATLARKSFRPPGTSYQQP
jgi:hypothetical protein